MHVISTENIPAPVHFVVEEDEFDENAFDEEFEDEDELGELPGDESFEDEPPFAEAEEALRVDEGLPGADFVEDDHEDDAEEDEGEQTGRFLI